MHVVVVEIYHHVFWGKVGLLHSGAAVLERTHELRSATLSQILLYYLSEPEVNQYKFVEVGAEADVVWLDVQMHHADLMHYFDVLEHVDPQTVEIFEAGDSLELVSFLHGEFDTVFVDNEVCSQEILNQGSNLQARSQFEHTVLSYSPKERNFSPIIFKNFIAFDGQVLVAMNSKIYWAKTTLPEVMYRMRGTFFFHIRNDNLFKDETAYLNFQMDDFVVSSMGNHFNLDGLVEFFMG